jgi:hypothetical protein
VNPHTVWRFLAGGVIISSRSTSRVSRTLTQALDALPSADHGDPAHRSLRRLVLEVCGTMH